MTTLPCPLPQVDEALRPYVHTRQETLRIRKILAEHYQSQLQNHLDQDAESTAITSLTLACSPPPLLPETHTTSPPELTGLRKKYWEAVQAHQLAQKRRDALHSELNELQQESQAKTTSLEPHTNIPPFTATAPESSSGQDVQTYIALLHQRRRHAKLQILLDALDHIADAQPNPLQRDVRQWVKDKQGDAPLPPLDMSAGGGSDATTATTTNLTSTNLTSTEDAAAKDQVLHLKKELLLAKQRLDTEKDRRAAAVSQPTLAGQHLEAQVRALRAARDELIVWIETELAKLAEGDESVLDNTPQRLDVPDRDATASVVESALPVQDQVEALYSRYVAARTSLISAVDTAAAAAKSAASTSLSPPPPPQQHAPASSPTAQLPPSTILPPIPALLHITQSERALAAHSAYLRQRLTRAQHDARTAMRRLASESHMVGPEAEGGLAWAVAAQTAAKEAEEVVGGWLGEGEERVEGARGVVGELGRRRGVFGGLRGDA